jgi:hypothetical protein
MPSTLPRRALAFFLPVAVLAVFACVLGYALVQQDLRSSANYPQLQLAEDAARALDAGDRRPPWFPVPHASTSPRASLCGSPPS